MKNTIIILLLLLCSLFVFHPESPIPMKNSHNFEKSNQKSISRRFLHSTDISSDYTPEFIDNLAIIGMPYLFQAIPQGSNSSLDYYLETNKSYLGFLYGDYLLKNVDLDIWVFRSNSSDVLNFSYNHALGEQDILEFTSNASTNYQIVIWNHLQEESYSYFGFVLLERITGSIFLNAPTVTPYNETPNYYTQYAVFMDWSEPYTDVNLSVSFDLPSGMIVEASLFYLFSFIDFTIYNPYELLEDQNAYDSGSFHASNDSHLSIPIGPQTSSWISKPGIVIAFQTIQGKGALELDFSSSVYYDIQFTTPIGVPQYVKSLSPSNYSLFSYYFRNDTKYDIFLHGLEINKSGQSNVNLQIWTGSPLEAEKEIQNPFAVPLEYSTEPSDVNKLFGFNPPSSERYTIVVMNMNNTSEVAAILVVFEHWELATTSAQTFTVERPDKWNLEKYSLNTFRSFLVPVRAYETKNLTFEISVPTSLEVEIRIFPFTTMLEQVMFSPFTNDGAICHDSGRNEKLDVFSQVGRRNGNRVNDTYWVVSVMAVLGKSDVNLTWNEAVVMVNWIDYAFTGILIVIALVFVILVSWRGEQFLS